MRLSTHFTLGELEASTTAARYDIDNTAPSNVIEAGRQVADKILEPIRKHFGVPFAPTSWYRGEELERVICAKAFAKRCAANKDLTWSEYFAGKSHPKGEAVDIKIAGVNGDELFEWCKKNLEFDQLIREYRREHKPYSGWVHISYKPVGNRNMVFTIG